MNKENKPGRVWKIALIVLLGFAFTGLLGFAIWEYIVSEKSVVRLGDYSNLTYTATNRDDAGTQVVDQLVERSRFGGLVKKNAEELAEQTVKRYQSNANYMEVTLEEYLSFYFGTTEEDFKKDVEASSLQVAKEEAVTDAVADKEGITLSDMQYETLLYRYMEMAGYTERELFLKDYNEKELRKQMRRDITVDFLLTKAKGPALTD
jgi:trigger factor